MLDPVIAEVCVKNCEKSAKTVVDSVIEPIAIVAETIENGEVLANDAIPSPRSGLRFARLLLPDNGDRPKGILFCGSTYYLLYSYFCCGVFVFFFYIYYFPVNL